MGRWRRRSSRAPASFSQTWWYAATPAIHLLTCFQSHNLWHAACNPGGQRGESSSHEKEIVCDPVAGRKLHGVRRSAFLFRSRSGWILWTARLCRDSAARCPLLCSPSRGARSRLRLGRQLLLPRRRTLRLSAWLLGTASLCRRDLGCPALLRSLLLPRLLAPVGRRHAFGESDLVCLLERRWYNRRVCASGHFHRRVPALGTAALGSLAQDHPGAIAGTPAPRAV